jgi:hypothetical protein
MGFSFLPEVYFVNLGKIEKMGLYFRKYERKISKEKGRNR